MNILFISGSLPPIKDGVGDYSAQLLSKLIQNYNIDVLSSVNYKKVTKESHVLSDWRCIRIPQLLKLINFRKYHIIHIQYPCSTYQRYLLINIIPLIAKLFNHKIKVITTLHNYYKNYTIIGKMRVYFLLLWTDHIIAVSKNIKQHLSEIPKIKSIPISFITIGSNFNFHTSFKQHPPTLKSIINIGYFGFINSTKNMEEIIAGLKLLKNLNYQFKWHLISEINNENLYHKRIVDSMEKSNILENTVFYKYMNESGLDEIFRKMDIMILFYKEGIDINKGSFIASAQHGIPIITNRGNSAPPKQIQHQVNCIVLNDLQPSNIRVAYDYILDPKNYIKISNNVYKLSKIFSWEEIKIKHETLYMNIRKL